MRIVFLNPIGLIGGAERVLLDAVASLRSADPTLELHVIVGGDGPLTERLMEAGATVIRLPLPAGLAGTGDSALIGGRASRVGTARRGLRALGGAMLYAARLRSAVRLLAPDLVHSNGIKMHLLARLGLGRRWPVVWHIHDFIGERPLARRLLRRAAGGACGAVAISDAVARDARTVLGSLPVEVVANAVDTDRFAPGPGDGAWLDRLAGFPPDDSVVRVGLVATYARWKGQDVFLDAVSQLGDAAARFYIIGGPIYQTGGSQFSVDELRARIAERGLTDRVGLIGFQADTPSVYRALDGVVHASTRPEPFGLTIVEAMACGRPVVVSAAGGAVELFTPQIDALGVPPGDVSALAGAIDRLIGNPALRRQLGESARQTVCQRFRRERLGPQLLAAYQRFTS